MNIRPNPNRCGGCGVYLSRSPDECDECGWRSNTKRAQKYERMTSAQVVESELWIDGKMKRQEKELTEEAYRRHPELRQQAGESKEEWNQRMRVAARTLWRKQFGNKR